MKRFVTIKGRKFLVGKDGYYVRKEGFLQVLRQARFVDNLKKGHEHPHDVMAYAHNIKEMKGMRNTITGGK